MNQIRFRSELRLDSGKLKTLRIPQTPYSAGEADTFSKASRSFPCLQRPPQPSTPVFPGGRCAPSVGKFQ